MAVSVGARLCLVALAKVESAIYAIGIGRVPAAMRVCMDATSG